MAEKQIMKDINKNLVAGIDITKLVKKAQDSYAKKESGTSTETFYW